MKTYRILTINPGSTSTKIALFENEKQAMIETIRHETNDLIRFKSVADQFEFRRDLILDTLKAHNIDVRSVDVIVARGGLLKPIPSGVYEVNEQMKRDLQDPNRVAHASNLGALIASSIAEQIGKHVKAYVADPVVVDEMQEVARFTGLPEFRRNSIFHALNQKATARIYARELCKKYEDLNLIIAHMGGGFSVGAHCKGKVIDVNDALDGDGPFSPERAGTLPPGQLVSMCFSGQYTEQEIRKKITGKGGLVAYIGSSDARDLEKAAEAGDEDAILLQDAMAYNVAKYIGAMAAVLKGDVDAILLTGGLAYGKPFVDYITQMVRFIAPVKVYPGEDEMAALAMNGLMVLKGETEPKEYK